jgi:hypothetical protein
MPRNPAAPAGDYAGLDLCGTSPLNQTHDTYSQIPPDIAEWRATSKNQIILPSTDEAAKPIRTDALGDSQANNGHSEAGKVAGVAHWGAGSVSEGSWLRWLRQGGAALILVFILWIVGGSKVAVAVVDAKEGHFEKPAVFISVSNLTYGAQFNVTGSVGKDSEVTCNHLRSHLENKPFPAFKNGRANVSESGPQTGYKPAVSALASGEVAAYGNNSGFCLSNVGYGDPDELRPNRIVKRTLNESDNNAGAMRCDKFLVGKLCYLLGGRNASLQLKALPTKYEQLQEAYSGQNASKFYQPPIGIRFVLFLSLIGGGFFMSLWGWDRFYNERRLFGATLIGCGLLLGGCGFFGWVAS